MTVGEKIKNMRQNLGYTQEQLAEKLLVSRQAIAKWEADRGIPDIENLKAISNFFGLSVDNLVNDNIEVALDAALNNEYPSAEETTVEETNTEETAFEENTIQDQPLTEDDYTNANPPVTHSNKKALCIFWGALLATILLVVILSVVIPASKRSAKMKKAEELMLNGSYLSAAEIYKEIDTSAAKDKYNECIYANAVKLYNEGDYVEAINQINSINYNDSAELLNAWKYELALLHLKNEVFTEAISIFEELGEYNDSSAKLDEIYYYYGAKLYNEKNFADAVSYLKKVSKESAVYTKSSDLYNKALYNKAVDLNNNKELGEAFNIFKDLIKTGNVKAAINAKHILNELLKNCKWDSPTRGNYNLTYIFSDFINKDVFDGKFYVYLVESDGSHESLAYKSKISTNENDTDAKWPIVLTGVNTQNSTDIIFLTFDYFSGNSKVYMHTHLLSDVDNCSVSCTSYTVNQPRDFSSYLTTYHHQFTAVALPSLSFELEIYQVGVKNEQSTSSENSTAQKENNENFENSIVEQNSSIDAGSTSSESKSSADGKSSDSKASSSSKISSSNKASSSIKASNSKSSSSSKYSGSKTSSKKTSSTLSSASSKKSSVATSPASSKNSSSKASKPISSESKSSSKKSSSSQNSSSPVISADPCADGHSWQKATCTTPKTCSICNETSGSANGHKWYEVTSTVHHDEVGHYENESVAYKVKKYRCSVLCGYNGKKYSSLEEYYAHYDSAHKSDSMYNIARDWYDTIDDWEYKTERVWVVDEEAYDETIITDYKCSVCGKIR